MPIARLAPGVALVTVPGRGLAVRTPDGEFLRVDTGDVPADALGLTWDTDHAPGLDALTQAFAEAGYLSEPGPVSGPAAASAPAAPAEGSAEPTAGEPTAQSVAAPPVAGPPRLAGRTVLVVGDPVLTAPLLHLLRDEGADARFAREAELTDAVDAVDAAGPGTAVVWCLDAPVPPGAWDAADRLPGRGVAWLRCHREGATAWIEPLAARPGDVTARHVRLRRLAATPAHRELDAYWAGSRTEDTGPRHGAASAALTAALLTAALLEWAAADGTGGGARTLRRIDLRDLTVTEHTVLPVPEVAPIRR